MGRGAEQGSTKQFTGVDPSAQERALHLKQLSASQVYPQGQGVLEEH